MKKELSWIPLASGSEAIEVATGAGLATTRKRATATKAHDFDFVLRAENCRGFMAGGSFSPLFPQKTHKVAKYWKKDSNPVTAVFDWQALEFTRADSWFTLIKPMQTAFY